MQRRFQSILVVLTYTFSAAALAVAAVPGPENFTLSLEPATAEGSPGGAVDLTGILRIDEGEVQGWSFGVCNDAVIAEVTDAVIEGTDTETIKDGDPPDFLAVGVEPNGATLAVVIDFVQQVILSPTERFSTLKISYRLDGAPGSEESVEYCETLGSPPVASVIVVGGQSIVPDTMTGATLAIVEGGGGPTLTTSPDRELAANMAATAAITVELGLSAEASQGVEMQGWSYGLAHDGALLELTEITPSSVTATCNGGSEPDFYAVNTSPAGGAGGTVGAVVSLGPDFYVIPIEPGERVHTETFIYRSATVLAPDASPVETSLRLAHKELGQPPVDAVMVILSDGFPLTEDGMATITLVPAGPGLLRQFRRGDANNDERINIADAVWILSWLFRGGPEPPCQDAADVNDDGALDESDAIRVAYYQLRQGPPPLPPFPACGTDPDDVDSDDPADGVTCLATGAGCPPPSGPGKTNVTAAAWFK